MYICYICPLEILSHGIVNVTIIYEKYKSLPFLRDKVRMLYHHRFFLLWAFQENVGAGEPLLSAFIKMKHGQLRLTQSRGSDNGGPGFLPSEWNLGSI